MTKPLKESYAVEKLTEQGFTVYCPLRPHEKLVRHKPVIKHLPLFPRYLFIEQDKIFTQQQHVLRSTPGVSQLIKQGEMAIKVNDEVIDAIRSLEQSHQSAPESFFTQHEPVKIRDGVYQHLEAIYLQDDGEQRALLLIQLLQKDTILSVEKSSLQKI